MAPSTAQAIQPQLLKQTRLNGFLTLPVEPLEPEEALSSHYLELHFGRPSQFSWGRRQESSAGTDDEYEYERVLPWATAAVQPRVTPERIYPPQSREASRRRDDLAGLMRPRRRKRNRSDDVFLVRRILEEEEQGDGFESSTDEEEEPPRGTASSARKASTAEGAMVPAKQQDLKTAMLMDVAEKVAYGVIVGSLVNINVQDEMAERLWRETRFHALDCVSPLSYVSQVLAANGHSWWQIDLAIKALAQKLELREKNELARNAMCAEEFSQFIEDMQQGVVRTEAEIIRYDGQARSNAYARIVQKIERCTETGPEKLGAEQEILLRSLRDAANNLHSVKKVIEDAHRLAHEARAAEGEQLERDGEALRGHDETTEFMEEIQDKKDRKSKKLSQDFQVAGRRFGKILHETEELEKLAIDHEKKMQVQQQQMVVVNEEFREIREKLRRAKRGTDVSTNEYLAYKQELEDDRDALASRVKREERVLEGQKGLFEALTKQLREVMMEEAAREMEDEAEYHKLQAQRRRQTAQEKYEDAQKRLRTADEVLEAVKSQMITGNAMEELMRIKQDVPALSEEADRSEAATAKERQRLAELQKWLKEFGQHEAADSASAYVEAQETRLIDTPEMQQAIQASPISIPFVLHRLLARRLRSKMRQKSGQVQECPDSARLLWLRQRGDGLQRSTAAATIEPSALEVPSKDRNFAARCAFPGAWRSPLLRAASAPAKLFPVPKVVAPPTSRRASAARRASAEGRRQSALRPDPKTVEAPEVPGPNADKRDYEGLATLAAAPTCRFDFEGQVPWDLWQKTWMSLWRLTRNIFKSLPDDAIVDEGVPCEVGGCISYLWPDCHLVFRRLHSICSHGMQGLQILQRLDGAIKAADKIMKEPVTRQRKQRRRGAPTDEECEETELQTLADSARAILEDGRKVLKDGLAHQQERMWMLSSLLAQILSIRKECTELLLRLRKLAERHEDLVFTCRIFAATALIPNLLEVEETTSSLRRWQRSVQVDTAAALAQYDMLQQDWRDLVLDEESVLASLEVRGQDLKVLVTLPVVVEEAALEVCTAMHCILENRWMRRKVAHMDRGALFDWKKSWKLLKEGNWDPLEETASLPSKETRTENPRLPVSSVMRGGGLRRQDSSGNTRAAALGPSPEVEEAMADLASELGDLGLEGLGLPSLTASPAGGRTPGGISSRAQSPLGPGAGSRNLTPDRPMLPARAMVRGSSRNLDSLLDEPEGGTPVSQPAGPRNPLGRDGSRRFFRGASRADLSEAEGERSGGSKAGSMRDLSRGDSGAATPLSSHRRRRNSDALLSPENREKVKQFEEAFQEIYQKRLQTATSPQEKIQQASLLDAAFKEMRQNLINSLAPSPMAQDDEDDFLMSDELMEQDVSAIGEMVHPQNMGRASQRRVTSDMAMAMDSPTGADVEFGMASSDSSSFGSEEDDDDESNGEVIYGEDGSVISRKRKSSKKKRKQMLKLHSQSWADGSRRQLSPDLENIMRLRSPQAVGLATAPVVTRRPQGRLRGRRRMEPLFLPWKPQDPQSLHLGEILQPVGRQGEENRCRSPQVGVPHVNFDTEMQKAALVNQVISRAGSPSRMSEPTPSRTGTPLLPEELEHQRRSMEEVMLPRALSRPSSAPSTVQAAGRFVGLQSRSASPAGRSLANEMLADKTEEHREISADKLPSSSSPKRPALRHTHTFEDASEPPSGMGSRVPSRPISATCPSSFPPSRPLSASPAGWHLVTPSYEPRESQKEPSILQASSLVYGESGLAEAEDHDAYLDAPLDDALLRPAAPPWLRAMVDRASSCEPQVPSESTEYPEMPGSSATGLSAFAVEQSPNLPESTPSPWYLWDRPPTSDLILNQRPPMPVARPSSTGESNCALRAQGHRCHGSEAVEARLPAIPGAARRQDEEAEARPATTEPDAKPATRGRRAGPLSAERSARWYRASSPQGLSLNCSGSPDGCDGGAPAGEASKLPEAVAQTPAGAGKPSEDPPRDGTGSPPRSGSRPPSTPRAGSRSPVRAVERRAEVSDYVRRAASAQRSRMEGPAPTLLAAALQQSGSKETPEVPRAPPIPELPKGTSVVLAATAAQRELVMQLKGKLKGKSAAQAKPRSDPEEGSASAWRNIKHLLAAKAAAADSTVEEFGAVLSKGLADKLDPETGRFIPPGKMRVQRSRFHTAPPLKPTPRGLRGS